MAHVLGYGSAVASLVKGFTKDQVNAAVTELNETHTYWSAAMKIDGVVGKTFALAKVLLLYAATGFILAGIDYSKFATKEQALDALKAQRTEKLKAMGKVTGITVASVGVVGLGAWGATKMYPGLADYIPFSNSSVGEAYNSSVAKFWNLFGYGKADPVSPKITPASEGLSEAQASVLKGSAPEVLPKAPAPATVTLPKAPASGMVKPKPEVVSKAPAPAPFTLPQAPAPNMIKPAQEVLPKAPAAVTLPKAPAPNKVKPAPAVVSEESSRGIKKPAPAVHSAKGERSSKKSARSALSYVQVGKGK